MEKVDLLYLLFLKFSLVAALVDKFCAADRNKGIYGAFIGIIYLLCLSGVEVLYPLVNIIVNTVIICYFGKRSGILTFIFTCGYLFYFRYFCSASSFTNVFMMSSTLKMISVATDFAIQKKALNGKTGNQRSTLNTIKDISFYALHYIGLIGVPFYTYKTYWEYITLPFKHHKSEWQYESIVCLIDSFTMTLARYLLNHQWPVSYLRADEFYNRSVFYRIWYVYPLGFDFILRVGNALVLTKAACIISGFGVYPDFTRPKCGHGPTENSDKMTLIKLECLHKYKYTYETIDNVNIEKMHFCVQMKKTMKYWNKTIQFWLYNYVYKSVPYGYLKKPATMMFSSYWHGLNSGNFLTWFFSSLALFIEERWNRILEKKNIPFVMTLLRIILKIHILYNLGTSFFLQKWSVYVKYQTSVYWHYLVILFFLFISSIFVKTKKI